jgi:integrase
MGVYARKRKSGTVYYASFMADGAQVHELVGPVKREAESVYKQRLREVAEGRYVARARSGDISVAKWVDIWCAERTNRDAAHDAQRLRDHVVPEVGKIRLRDVRSADMVRLIGALKSKGLSPKMVRNVWGSARTLFRDAAVQELLPRDPCVLKRGVLPKVPRKRREIYETSDVTTLLTDERVTAETRVWCALAFYLGLRKGEVCGLRWSDWDAVAKPLGAMSIVRQYQDRPLKTDEERRVPVHPHLAAILDEWQRVGFELWHARKPRSGDPIVPRPDGKAMTESMAYKRFMAACEATGVRGRTVHSGRHTFITAARRGGAPQDMIEVLTHNAKGTMVDHYTHWEWEPLCRVVAGISYVAPHDAVSETGGNGSTAEPAWGFEVQAPGGKSEKGAEKRREAEPENNKLSRENRPSDAPYDARHAIATRDYSSSPARAFRALSWLGLGGSMGVSV